MIRGIRYRAGQGDRALRVSLPRADVLVAQHVDERWMWGITFATVEGGEGFYPLPKWGRFAPTERAAIEAGLAELIARLGQRTWADCRQARELRCWAEAQLAPAQPDLFPEAA